jgi:hypothetical protein
VPHFDLARLIQFKHAGGRSLYAAAQLSGKIDAAILSLIRSPVTLRSNCTSESNTLSVSRPIDVVVLN